MDQVWKGLSNLDPRDQGGFYKKKKFLKVGMSDMQEWTEEDMEPNKTLYLYFSLCMFKIYERVRKQFLQL